MIRLEKVRMEDRQLLFNINQKYLYEMTNYYDDMMDRNGNYSYGYFDGYFTDPNRKAFFIYDDERMVGFAFVNPYSYFDREPDHVMAEFTVFPAFRNRHYGETAARMLLERFPGKWEIKYNEKNIPARNLWNKMAERYRPEKLSYSEDETVLCFTVPGDFS